MSLSNICIKTTTNVCTTLSSIYLIAISLSSRIFINQTFHYISLDFSPSDS